MSKKKLLKAWLEKEQLCILVEYGNEQFLKFFEIDISNAKHELLSCYDIVKALKED